MVSERCDRSRGDLRLYRKRRTILARHTCQDGPVASVLSRKDTEHYARLFALRVIALIETIPNFPKAGRIVPEYQRDSLREIIFQNYRIVYRISHEVIEIVAIVHGARLLPDINA